jgi:transcriptional regulator with XRE-family HTH domain
MSRQHTARAAKVFAKRLAELRKQRHLTQVELAAQVGVSRGIVAFYESCQTNPTLETVERFADFFGVSMTYMLEDTEDRPSHPGPPSKFERHIEQVRKLSPIQQRRLANMIDAFLTTA